METFIPKTSKSTEWTKIDKNGVSRLAVYKKEIGANQFCLHLFLLYFFYTFTTRIQRSSSRVMAFVSRCCPMNTIFCMRSP